MKVGILKHLLLCWVYVLTRRSHLSKFIIQLILKRAFKVDQTYQRLRFNAKKYIINRGRCFVDSQFIYTLR